MQKLMQSNRHYHQSQAFKGTPSIGCYRLAYLVVLLIKKGGWIKPTKGSTENDTSEKAPERVTIFISKKRLQNKVRTRPHHS